MTTSEPDPEDPRRVHPVVERLAAYGWRVLVLGAVVVAALWLIGQLWILLLALVVAGLLARVLDAPARWLRAHRVPPGLSALLALLLFLGGLVAVGWGIVPAMADEFDSLGTTVEDALDDLEDWLVEDSPLDVTRRDLQDLRTQAGDAVSSALRSSGDTVVSGALVAIEVFTGLVLALISTFFFLKDGPRFQEGVLARLRPEHREPARRYAATAWQTIGGYLRGAALLGALEGAVIGLTLAIIGAHLVIPVVLLTFAAAFVPMVGAIAAGVVAVLVAFATAGFGGALAVAVVALVVQQLDNDLLAPVIYGRSLELHPLVILFSIVGGGALFGFAGTVLAVPFVAVLLNVGAEAGLGRPRT